MPNNAPVLRMSGFDQAWKTRAFADLARRRTEVSNDASLPTVEYEDIVSGEGLLNKDLAKKATHKGGMAFRPGDVLYGKLRPYLENWLLPGFPGIAVGDWWVLQPSEVDPTFLYQLVQASCFAKVANVASGSKMPRADWALVSSTEFGCPPTADEQSAIGQLLSELDRLTACGEQEMQKTLQLKKAMLCHLFPTPSSNVPSLRFDGFDQPWERRDIGELWAPRNDKNAAGENGDKIISVANMYYSKDRFIGSPDYLATFNHMRLGDIAYEGNRSGNFRYGRFVLNDIGDGVVSHVFRVFRPIGDGDIDYWKYAIHNEQTMAPVLARCTKSSTMMHELVTDDFLAESLLVPDVEEQRAIGQLLSELDRLIDAKRQELEKLKQVKQALLQKMFV